MGSDVGRRRGADADVIVVGAGMSGLYAVKVLREQGFRGPVLEKGSGVGGTWFWNRYPGCSVRHPSLEYSFGFNPELEQEWVWTEHFGRNPEIERYLNHFADRYDLRRDIRLSTGVRSMTFDEETDTWVFDAETGEQFRARFAVMATGGLSAPNRPAWAGIDEFEGHDRADESVARRWRRARRQAHRHRGRVRLGAGDPRAGQGGGAPDGVPAHCRCSTWPSRTSPSPTTNRRRSRRGTASCVRSSTRRSVAPWARYGRGDLRLSRGAAHPREHARRSRTRRWKSTASVRVASGATPRRQPPCATRWPSSCSGEMVRRTVKDPDVAEALSPRGYPLGCKRPVLDSNYFETFNRDNVTLVDLGNDPIEQVTPTGVRTSQQFVELDVLVLATGFDAMTGVRTRRSTCVVVTAALCATTGPTGPGPTWVSVPRAIRTSSSVWARAAPACWRPTRRRSSCSSAGSPTSSTTSSSTGTRERRPTSAWRTTGART